MVSLRALASVFALAAPFVSALTAQQIVDNINMLTVKSQALQGPANSITIINGPLIIIGQGPFPVCSGNPVFSLVSTQLHNPLPLLTVTS